MRARGFTYGKLYLFIFGIGKITVGPIHVIDHGIEDGAEHVVILFLSDHTPVGKRLYGPQIIHKNRCCI